MIWAALPFTLRLGIIAGVVVIVGGLITWNQIRQYNKGWTAAIAAIAKKDKEAYGRAGEGVKAVQECDDRGGTWNVTNGVCE